jgi:hypothetical protein
VPNVAEIIKDHVTLKVRCRDRLYLNAYVPRLQSSGGVADFLIRGCGQKIASPAIFGQITTAFTTHLRTWADQHGIPWIKFRKGDRKDTVVQRLSRPLCQIERRGCHRRRARTGVGVDGHQDPAGAGREL